jgi:hypothetical protein
VFFLKADGCSTDGVRWNDGHGRLNFTWLRAPLTPGSSFESLGVYEADKDDEARLSAARAAASRKASLFAKRRAEDDEKKQEELVIAQKKIDEATALAAAKMRMSEGVHTWVMCPFRLQRFAKQRVMRYGGCSADARAAGTRAFCGGRWQSTRSNPSCRSF